MWAVEQTQHVGVRRKSYPSKFPLLGVHAVEVAVVLAHNLPLVSLCLVGRTEALGNSARRAATLLQLRVILLCHHGLLLVLLLSLLVDLFDCLWVIIIPSRHPVVLN